MMAEEEEDAAGNLIEDALYYIFQKESIRTIVTQTEKDR